MRASTYRFKSPQQRNSAPERLTFAGTSGYAIRSGLHTAARHFAAYNECSKKVALEHILRIGNDICENLPAESWQEILYALAHLHPWQTVEDVSAIWWYAIRRYDSLSKKLQVELGSKAWENLAEWNKNHSE